SAPSRASRSGSARSGSWSWRRRAAFQERNEADERPGAFEGDETRVFRLVGEVSQDHRAEEIEKQVGEILAAELSGLLRAEGREDHRRPDHRDDLPDHRPAPAGAGAPVATAAASLASASWSMRSMSAARSGVRFQETTRAATTGPMPGKRKALSSSTPSTSSQEKAVSHFVFARTLPVRLFPPGSRSAQCSPIAPPPPIE